MALFFTKLIRDSPGTPKNVNIYGYLFDIDTNKLTEVVDDQAAEA